MDYLVCKKAFRRIRHMSQTDSILTNVKNITEAISQTREIALDTREGVMVALFTHDAKPVCGWKVMEEGELKYVDIDVIQDFFYNVSPEDFKLARRQYEIRRDLHLTTMN